MVANIPGLTEGMVNASVQSNVIALRPFREELEELVYASVKLVQLSATVGYKHRKLISIVSNIGEIAAKVTPCKKGCSHCCKMAVAMTSYEANVIGNHIGVPPAPVVTDLNNLESFAEEHIGKPCPFLKKSECSIYEVRPIACRTHFNLSSYPALCDLIDHPGNSVPNLNLNTLWNAQMQIYAADSEFGDIRDFFPDGARTVQSL